MFSELITNSGLNCTTWPAAARVVRACAPRRGGGKARLVHVDQREYDGLLRAASILHDSAAVHRT